MGSVKEVSEASRRPPAGLAMDARSASYNLIRSSTYTGSVVMGRGTRLHGDIAVGSILHEHFYPLTGNPLSGP